MTSKFITDWAAAWKTPEEKLQKEFDEIVEKFRAENPNKSPEIIEQNAKNQLKTKYSKHARSRKGTSYVGYVLNVGSVRNTNTKLHKELTDALEQYRQAGELNKAVEEGIIRIDVKTGQEIFLNPKLKRDGGERKDAGQDFSLENGQRQELHLLTEINGEMKYAVLEMQGKDCRKGIVEKGQIIEFTGVTQVKQENDFFKIKPGVVYLRTNTPEFVLTNAPEFENKVRSLTPEELIKIFEGIPQVKVSDVLTILETEKKLPNSYKFDLFAITNGVAELDLVPSKAKEPNIKIYLEDDGDSVSALKFTCLLPAAASGYINFADGSKILAIGSAFESYANKDKTGDPDGVMVKAVLVAAYPDFLIPMRDNGHLSEDDIIPKEVRAAEKKKLDEEEVF